jgi:hypothetical protein
VYCLDKLHGLKTNVQSKLPAVRIWANDVKPGEALMTVNRVLAIKNNVARVQVSCAQSRVAIAVRAGPVDWLCHGL